MHTIDYEYLETFISNILRKDYPTGAAFAAYETLHDLFPDQGDLALSSLQSSNMLAVVVPERQHVHIDEFDACFYC